MNLKCCAVEDELETSLDRDCAMIFEAIRRLIEGTCCLRGEEIECTWDLFHKINEAFAEHRAVEERHLFPLLSTAERQAHQVEHRERGAGLSVGGQQKVGRDHRERGGEPDQRHRPYSDGLPTLPAVDAERGAGE